MRTERTGCVIAGGGPAGLVLALLLVRAGVPTTVLEKHADFLRDFRGDTVHPSTLRVLDEIGLLEPFLKLPHQKVTDLGAVVAGEHVRLADFRRTGPVGALVLMPQWDLLDFLAREAAEYPGFRLHRRSEVVDLVETEGAVRGVRAETPDGPIEVLGDLVVAADGRNSTVRERAGLPLEVLGAPIDVLWFRVTRRPSDPDETFGRIDAGSFAVLINRGDNWQCAYVIGKGDLSDLRAAGIASFRDRVARSMPFAADRLQEIEAWDDVKLLDVQVNRLRQWYRPGLLCIGDAAHAMSPIGGVGINLAVQDAVATANALAAPLRARSLTIGDLASVQRRRMLPTRLVQSVQVLAQNRILAPVLGAGDDQSVVEVPRPVQVVDRVRPLRRVAARLMGFGVRPEHVRSREEPPP